MPFDSVILHKTPSYLRKKTQTPEHHSLHLPVPHCQGTLVAHTKERLSLRLRVSASPEVRSREEAARRLVGARVGIPGKPGTTVPTMLRAPAAAHPIKCSQKSLKSSTATKYLPRCKTKKSLNPEPDN
jgi:hypothetical protein